MLRTACTRIGLPEPEEVFVTNVPPLPGGVHARRWPTLTRKSPEKPNPRPHAHAVLRFAEPVRGPVLIGAGRFRGWGLSAPLRDPAGGTTSR